MKAHYITFAAWVNMNLQDTSTLHTEHKRYVLVILGGKECMFHMPNHMVVKTKQVQHN